MPMPIVGQLGRVLPDYTQAIQIDPILPSPITTAGPPMPPPAERPTRLADYNKAIELNPRYVEAISTGGRVPKAGQAANALADFSKAVQLSPSFAQAYYSREPPTPKRASRPMPWRTITRPSSSVPLCLRLLQPGGANDSSGQPLKAIADFTKAIELMPKFAVAYFSRGLAQAEMGRRPKRRKTCNRRWN